MPAERSDSPPPGGVSRRRFIVMMAGAVLGSYRLPQLPQAVTAASASTGEATRQLITKPTKKKTGQGFFLLWTEETPRGVEAMIWAPETATECAEAQRFYEDARGFNARAPRRTPVAPPPERSTEETALLRAVLDNPGDEATYLAYAAWLERHGYSQGEFVRLSIQVEGLAEDDPARKLLDERWSELLNRDAAKWVEPLTALGLRPEIMGIFYPAVWLLPNGLVEEIEIDKPGILPDQAERLFRAAPLLRKITFNYDTVDLHGIADVPQMAQVTGLEASGLGLSLQDLRAVFASRQLKRLKLLNFSHNEVGPQAGRLTAGSRLLGQLETLILDDCGLGDEGVQALVGSVRCGGLTSLRLKGNGLGAEGFQAVAASPHLGQLRQLDLGGHRVGAAGIRALTPARFLRSLLTLGLEECDVDAEAAALLATLPLVGLTALKLNSNPLGPDGSKALAASPHLGKLRALELDLCELHDAGAVGLAAGGSFRELTELDLSRNQIGDLGVTALAAAPCFVKLRRLKLWKNRCGAAGASALAASPTLSALRDLDLTGNDIGPAGAIALARSTHLQKLRSLRVDEAAVGKAGKRALLARFDEEVVSFLD
jgi:uncharacterized protein (TIGR02996 family)